MAFDLNRSYFNDLRERAVAPAASITEEGQLLMYVDAGDGTLAVQRLQALHLIALLASPSPTLSST